MQKIDKENKKELSKFLSEKMEKQNENSTKEVKKRIKAFDPHIVVNKDVDKPYYSILYYDIADKKWHLGFGSYMLEYVIKWLEEEFEEVNVEFEEVKHGTWIVVGKTEGRSNILQCSVCKRIRRGVAKTSYCKDCGAKMN